MTHRHDDADPIEHDPTGMRALLGSLPDPGPMPDDLVARITAALDAESGHRDAGEGGTVVPLHRRRGWQLLGVAAAAVVAFGVGGVVVEQLAPGGLQATLGLARSASGDSAAGGSAAEAGAPSAADGRAGVLVLASGTDYTASGLTREAGALPVPATDGDAAQKDIAALPTGSGLVADAAGARDCAAALGVDAAQPVVVDVATMGGRPVAILVAAGADGSRQVWVVERTCHEGAPGVVAGPIGLAG